MLTLRLPAMIASIRAVGPALSGLPGWDLMSAGKQHDVLLATTELVVNAIVHGSKGGESSWITIKADINPQEIVIVVINQGSGFDYSKVADPSIGVNRERPGGRGLFVVGSLADLLTVECQDGECRVTIHFACP